MKEQVFIINGSGGVGKDQFVSFVRVHSDVPVYNYSSVDKIKEIAKDIGWDGSKTEYNRKFLSDLKMLCMEYNDLPLKYLSTKIQNHHQEECLIFLHIREPKEIEKAKQAFNAKTILIKRDSIEHIVSNEADKDVFNYEYDIIVENNGTLDDFYNKAKAFAIIWNSKYYNRG